MPGADPIARGLTLLRAATQACACGSGRPSPATRLDQGSPTCSLPATGGHRRPAAAATRRSRRPRAARRRLAERAEATRSARLARLGAPDPRVADRHGRAPWRTVRRPGPLVGNLDRIRWVDTRPDGGDRARPARKSSVCVAGRNHLGRPLGPLERLPLPDRLDLPTTCRSSTTRRRQWRRPLSWELPGPPGRPTRTAGLVVG
jgi:hypothetical protein